jgi:hypothetical protein
VAPAVPPASVLATGLRFPQPPTMITIIRGKMRKALLATVTIPYCLSSASPQMPRTPPKSAHRIVALAGL